MGNRVKKGKKALNKKHHFFSFLVYFWAGWWDEPEEGIFSNINNKFSGPSIPNLWQKSEPNGDRAENCVAINTNDFVDVPCNFNDCGACEINQ